uniref:Capsid protein n=1 Tax=Dulem virus 40 TaxID=3145758 RepID=A0AAU8AUP3_9CAUD
MGLGRLNVEFHASLPNDLYPDGTLDKVVPMPLDITLVPSVGDCPSMLEVEASVPYAVIDAYDMAVASGYEGTREDYTASLRLLPGLAATVSDLRQGKREIAEALTEQGIPTAADAPMSEMAEGVRRLYAVPDVDAGARDRACSTDADHTGAYDMVNEVNRHRRGDYPYVCGCSFIGREVTLAGADATLLSDGTWIEGRDAVEHTFAGGMSHWAIFYFKQDFYSFPWPQGVTIVDIAALDSHPCFSASSAKPFVSLFVDAEPADYDGHDFSFGDKAGNIVCNAVSSLPSGNPIASGNAQIQMLSMPSLTTSRRQITNGCPSLFMVCLPHMENASSAIVVSSGRGIEADIILTNLKTNSASPLVYMPRGLKKLYLPHLEATTGSIGVYLDDNCEMYLPALVRATNSYLVTNGRGAVIHLGSQKGANLILNGQSVEGVAAINIKPGFTGTLVFNNTSLTAENLRELLVNLGDNTDGATMRIQMGANNLAKLTEDEIAVATAKNYTVS